MSCELPTVVRQMAFVSLAFLHSWGTCVSSDKQTEAGGTGKSRSRQRDQRSSTPKTYLWVFPTLRQALPVECRHVETLLVPLLITEPPLAGSLSSLQQINIPCPLHG